MADPITERSAAVQAGVNAYLEEEVRRIQMLPVEEQEKEFSALMVRKIDHISKMGSQNPEQERAIARLIALETDRVLMLDSGRQQKVIAAKYGLDPGALINNYPELQTKYAELQKRLKAADRNTAFMGWTAFFGTASATLIPFWGRGESLAKKFSGGNRLIKWFFVSLASLAAGFATNFIGSRLFGSKVREESKALVNASRIALERELADAIGHKVREGIAAATTQTPAAPAPDFKAGVERKAPPQPREGFAAEAAKEKAAAQAAGAGVG